MKLRLLVALLLVTIGCHALPLGNPAAASLLSDSILLSRLPCNLSLRIGFYGDYVFDRHLELDTARRPGMRQTEIYTNAGYLALNYKDRLDLFATLGSSQLTIRYDQSIFGPAAGMGQITMQSEFSWSIGGRVTIVEYCGIIFGAETQFFRFRPFVDQVSIAAVELLLPFINDIHGIYREWQGGIGAAYPIGIAECGRTALVPYIGYKFGSVWLEFPDQPFTLGSFTFDFEQNKLQGSKNYGSYVIGLTLVGCNRASITAEARFIDERAFHINSQFRF